jgi:hypothetical protein
MKEAMKQALEALEDAKTHGLVYVNEIVDLRQAIAASEKQGELVGTAGELFTNSALERLDLRPSTKIYTTPQRTWVGLTDEEIDKAWRSVDYTVPLEQLRIDIAQAIEAKLKEKNT